MLHLITSLALGIFLGYLYGLSFGTAVKGESFFRVIIFGLIFFYVLHYTPLNPILVLVAFLLVFWLIILQKALSYAKHSRR